MGKKKEDNNERKMKEREGCFLQRRDDGEEDSENEVWAKNSSYCEVITSSKFSPNGPRKKTKQNKKTESQLVKFPSCF